jgi:hypothetical protein
MGDTTWDENPHTMVSVGASYVTLAASEFRRIVDGVCDRPEGGDIYRGAHGGQVYVRHELVEWVELVDEAVLAHRDHENDIRRAREVTGS